MTTPSSDGYVSIGVIAKDLGISVSQVRLLGRDGTLPPAFVTPGGHRRYDLHATRDAWAKTHRSPGGSATEPVRTSPEKSEGELQPSEASHTIERTDPIANLDESDVWRALAPQLRLEPQARYIAQYAFTEMLNNAIDHSRGTYARTRITDQPRNLIIEIQDDGIGIFEHLREAKNLPDRFAAVAELTKGKQTTAPEAHTGEGIFFTSKAVNVFRLEANEIAWTVDNDRDDQGVGTAPHRSGTLVRLTIDKSTTLSLGDVFREYTIDDQFARTRPVIKLFTIGVDFVSRSEAKRLMNGLEKFTEVELDFTDVESVGQGFVDEVFRVWANAHPNTLIEPTNMNAAIDFMVRRGLPKR